MASSKARRSAPGEAMSEREFNAAVKHLRQDFEKDTLPAIRRHDHAQSRGQSRRFKHHRALRRQAKQEAARKQAA